MKTLVTARAIILDSKGRMLIVRRSKSDPLQPGSWDLPGGRVENGETVEAAVIRETREEVGLEIHAPQLLFATSDIRADASKTWIFFVASLPDNAAIVLSYEHDHYQWIKPGVLDEYTDYEILRRLHAYVTGNHLLD